MFKRVFTFISIALVTSNIINAQTSYPSYNDVLTRFIKSYTLKKDQIPNSLHFSKTPEGYVLEEYNYSSNEFLNRQLFWSAKDKEFKPIDYPAGPAPDYVVKILQGTREAFWLDIHTFYGYSGWERDNIDYLMQRSKLKEDDYYSLARSYASLANNKFKPTDNFSQLNEDKYDLDEMSKEQLTDVQIRTYHEEREFGREYLAKLCDLNPEYETLIGTACTEYSNDYMVEFLDLKMYHNEEVAMNVVPDDLYSKAEIEKASNYLNACEKNAILFTRGDMDTYPLLYLQAKKGLRKDVTVVNLSLLNLGAYVNDLKSDFSKIYGRELTTLKAENYQAEKLDLVLVNDQIPAMSLKKYLEVLSEENKILQEVIDGKVYFMLPSKKLQITDNKGGSILYNILSSGIDQGSLLALDIIQTNNTHNSIYFTDPTILALSNSIEESKDIYKLIFK